MIGKQCVFNYPKEFVTLPEYTARRGQIVTVVRLLDSSECDQTEEDQMYRIQAMDGWQGDAWESELEVIN